jgi:hypothetical protein
MSDKIIKFPGSAGAKPSAEAAPSPASAPVRGPDGLTDDQRKAIQVVMSGMPFVLVGIKATDRGADFFTAIEGEPGDLRNAFDHLPGVIERAYGRKGLI